jgi:hypothetical protein
MVKRARTKDETFMIRLFEEASKLPEIDDPLDRYHIGKLTGLHPKATDTICVLLAQANFIKKISTTEIALTSHGMKLVNQLLEN